MKLSEMLSFLDKLSAQMNKASKNVAAMTDKVNKTRDAISKIAATQNINISVHSNISEIVKGAKLSITSLQNTISKKELSLQTRINLDDLNTKTINAKLSEIGNYLSKNTKTIKKYNNKLAILRKKQIELTESSEDNAKLDIEQSIESLEKKLADIENAKRQFAEWKQIKLDYKELEATKLQISTLEHALKNLNSINVAVRAYIDFKIDALKQIYDIDKKLKTLGQKITRPIVKLKDKATEKINSIKEKAKTIDRKKFAPIIAAIDKAKPILSFIKTGLAKIAGTVAYPIIKIKDKATRILVPIKSKLGLLGKKIFTPEVRLKAKQIFDTFKEMSEKQKGLGAKIGKVLTDAMGKAVKGLANSVGVAVKAIGDIGTESINTGSQFEASMSQAAAAMGMTADEANYNNEVYARLADTAKQMGASTKFSASEAAEALNYLAINGYKADDACTVLPTIMKLATVEGMDLAAASDMVTDSMSALGIAATKENLTQFGDQLVETAQKSKTSIGQLGEAILTVGGTAKSLAGGNTELNALLGILADSGAKGAEGGEQLRDIITALQTPTDAAAKKLNALGVSVYDAQGKMRPMNKVLEDLNSSMNNMTDGEKQNALSTIFKDMDLKSVNALLDSCGARFDELSGDIANSDGAMENTVNAINNNLQGRVTELQAALKGTEIAIYEALGSSGLKDLVKEASGWIGELTKATEEGGMEGLAGAIGPILAKIGTKISDMAPQIVQAGVEIINNLVSGIQSNLPQIISSLTSAGTVFVQGILKVVPQLLIAGGDMILQLAESVTGQLPQLLDSGVAAVETLVQGIVDGAPMMVDVVVQIITTLSDFMQQNLQPILDAALQVLLVLVKGFIEAIPVLVPAVIQIIMGLIQFISENLGTIVMAALDILMALVQGLIDSIPVLIPAIVEVVMNIVQFISDNLPMILKAALNIILALVQGLIEAIPQLVEGVLDLVSSIWDTIINTDWIQLGMDLIEGIGKGLVEGVKAIGETIGNVASSIVDKFKGFLGIHSASTVMKTEVGFNVGAGVAKGLQETKAMINNEVESLADDMTVMMGASLSNITVARMKYYKPSELEKPKYSQKPRDTSSGSYAYQGMGIAQPVNSSNVSNLYSDTAENTKQEVKKYYIEKIIENVTITGEGDEDRLVEKVLAALAEDIEETAENMGEEDFD